MLKIIFSLILLATTVGAVTQAQIDAQEAVVATAQATLDSLKSLRLADQVQAKYVVLDSTLTANGVQVLVGTPPYDPLYVRMDVPYSTWTDVQKKYWDAKLLSRAAPEFITVGTGQYLVHRTNILKWLNGAKFVLGQM